MFIGYLPLYLHLQRNVAPPILAALVLLDRLLRGDHVLKDLRHMRFRNVSVAIMMLRLLKELVHKGFT